MHALALSLLGILNCLLYLPFLNNTLTFDDQWLLSGEGFAYRALFPLGSGLRHPPYFSLALVQVLFGTMEAHRLTSLAAHTACAFSLYAMLIELLRARHASPFPSHATSNPDVLILAVCGAAIFAMHPAATYGAGYLIQRSIVFATLFAMLSATVFAVGLRTRKLSYAFVAAGLFMLSVLSKEHAILVPAAVAMIVLISATDRSYGLRYAATYLLLCMPIAVYVILLSKGIIGVAYEPAGAQIAAELEKDLLRPGTTLGWALSAVTQAGLFFWYLSVWLWPSTSSMSIDVRIDFLNQWSAGWILVKAAAHIAWVSVAGYLLLARRSRWSLIAWGMMYAWILYLVEFGAIRLQEPAVLYRSYLWAPGFIAIVIGLLRVVPTRAVIAIVLAICPLLFHQARDRLLTLSTPVSIWEDAVAKLPAKPVPMGSRTLYNLGGVYLSVGREAEALAVTERCVSQYPSAGLCYFARASVYYTIAEYAKAQQDYERVIALNPSDSKAYNYLAMAIEIQGDVEGAKRLYRRSIALGFKGAEHHLMRLEKPGTGLLPPGPLKPASRIPSN